jgi:hypothetical protein
MMVLVDSSQFPMSALASFETWRPMNCPRPTGTNQLNDALKRSFRQSEGRSGTYDKPRHGIRVSRSGEIVDLRIDFEGRDVHIYRNNEPDGSFSITDSAQAIFNDVLKKANIPIVGKFDAEQDEYERFHKPVGTSIGHAR